MKEQGDASSGKKPGGPLKLAVLVGLLVAVILVTRVSGVGAYMDQGRLQAWIAGFGMWGPVVYMAIYILAPVLFLPGLPITIAGGLLFGPVYGVLYTITSSTAGACLAFLVARYLGRDWIGTKIRNSGLATLDERVEKQGWKIVAITRLIPIFPFNLLNYAFGLTKIRFVHYALTSFICMLPGCIAYIVFSSSILDLLRGNVSGRLLLGIALLVGVSLIPVLYKKRKGRQVMVTAQL
ncbi:MAG: TVP38/TMEM64 family protein [Deltaproteobacteria bacterium]|nr:TVP38/TMEM64 family protein [Deltaproteobacteria bacterium]